MEDRAGEIIDKGGRENAHVMMGARGTGMCPFSSTMFGCNYIVCRLGPEFHDQADRVALETPPSRGESCCPNLDSALLRLLMLKSRSGRIIDHMTS